MTDARAALVERIVALYADKYQITDAWLASAAIDLVLEEAAPMTDITIPRKAKEAANKIEYLMRLHDDMSDTIEELRAEVEKLKASRDLVLEEAARVVMEEREKDFPDLRSCARAIRALKSGT